MGFDEVDNIGDALEEWESEMVAAIAGEIGSVGRLDAKSLEEYDAKKTGKKVFSKIVSALAVAVALEVRMCKKKHWNDAEEWHTENKYLYDHQNVEYMPARENPKLKQIIEASSKEAAKEILNLTKTKAICVYGEHGQTVRLQDEIYKVLGDAVAEAKSGGSDFYTAMRRAVLKLGGGGARVDYGDGVTRRLDTVVRQNLLYGIKKANIEYTEMIAKELNCDGYEIDAHNNSRDSHLFMQGQQYCTGKGRTINGTYFVGFEEVDPQSPDGLSASEALNDYGCRHYRAPIICGISEPRFTKEQLQEIKNVNTREYEVGGKKGNRYFWTQKMRALETEIRKSKGEINALQTFGNSNAQIKDLRQHIKVCQSKYDQITEVVGIDKEPERMKV